MTEASVFIQEGGAMNYFKGKLVCAARMQSARRTVPDEVTKVEEWKYQSPRHCYEDIS